MAWEQVVSITALVLAVAAVIVGLVLLRKISERGQRVPGLVGAPPVVEEDRTPPGPPAFVINPVKTSDADAVRRLAQDACAELGLPEPLWFETTVEDPGRGQALEALAQGASVVVAAGGDGTVRAVGSALAGSRVPMGLLPLGTGNLLARNLDLPVDGTRALIHTALTGADHAIDLGWIRPERLRPVEEDAGVEDAEHSDTAHADRRPGAEGKRPKDVLGEQEEHLFLVMGGVGFDAAMVAGADDDLKAKMGWLAYFVAGAQHLHSRRIRLRMELGDAAPQNLKLRSLLFANCGRLPGGIVLLPDAELDDGWLDVAAIDTRGGLIGWASLFGKVILQGIGVRRQLPASPGSIEFWRAKDITVRCDRPEPVQVDGDLIGEAVGLTVRIQPGGLLVRTKS